MSINDVLLALTQNGIRFDLPRYEQGWYREHKEQLASLQEELFYSTGRKFSCTNSSDIRAYLHERNLNPKDEDLQKFLKRNRCSDKTLEQLHDFVKLVRQLTVFNPGRLKEHLDDNSRFIADWSQATQTTGRIICSNPPLQSMPRTMREYFIPEDGNALITVDYSSIDLRALAKLSGDTDLITALGPGKDIHRKTASAVFQKDPSDITDEERQIGKHVNYMISYGGTARGLSDTLSSETGRQVSIPEAEKMIYCFFDAYPLVYYYQHGLMYGKPPITIGGHKFDKLKTSQKLNYPVQGSVAEGFQKTLETVVSTAPDSYLLVMAIHDSITLEVPVSEREKAEVFLQSTAETVMGAFLAPVPVFAELKNTI